MWRQERPEGNPIIDLVDEDEPDLKENIVLLFP